MQFSVGYILIIFFLSQSGLEKVFLDRYNLPANFISDVEVRLWTY